MTADDIIKHKRTITVPKTGVITFGIPFNTVQLTDVDANLVLRTVSNEFYTFDVIITGRQVAAVGVAFLRFFIANSQEDETNITNQTILPINVTDTLFATDTFRTDFVNNILSIHELYVYGEIVA